MELEKMRLLGLAPGEIKVYSAILYSGSSTINKIHEKTGLERRGIYDILNKLIEKGYITYTVEKGKRTYQCAPPHRILEETRHRIEELQEFKTIIPEVESVYHASKSDINIEVFRGKEGIKAIFEDMLDHKDNYFIGGRWIMAEEMPVFWAHYDKRRIKMKVRWHNLVQHDAPETPTKRFVFVKRLPKQFSASPVIVWIYGNKVVHVVWSGSFFAFLMESKEIADNYRKYFKYLWENVAEERDK